MILFLWYLKQSFETAYTKGDYDDDMITINRIKDQYIAFAKNTSDYIDKIYELGLNKITYNEFKFDYMTYHNPFRIKFKSPLLKTLLSKCSINTWVEIENEFYESLKNTLTERSNERNNNIINLNTSLKCIINNLEKYLLTVKPTHFHAAYRDIFESTIKSKEIVTVQTQDIHPNDTLVLNFNYTSTIEEYFNSSPYQVNPKKLKVNYIHGKLSSKFNEIIFGFGDELDKDYENIEAEKSKGFLQYIKSFWYFKTSNYHDLIRFIELEDFQVYILGHSCGLSDRTMLNMIFEHVNCKSIKIFYYQNENGYNNYQELTQEISRHFKNKGEMRKKIVPFNLSTPMPQIEIS